VYSSMGNLQRRAPVSDYDCTCLTSMISIACLPLPLHLSLVEDAASVPT